MNLLPKKIFIFLFLVLLSACVDKFVYQENMIFPVVETKKNSTLNFDLIFREKSNDNYTKIYLIPSDHISLKKSNIKDINNHFWGTPFVIQKINGDRNLYFKINHEGHNLLHVHNDVFSLFVKADSVFYKFKSVTLPSEEEIFIYQCFQQHALNINIEKIFYPISSEQLFVICFAKNLQFRLEGNSTSFFSIIPEETKEYWREFYKRIIKK